MNGYLKQRATPWVSYAVLAGGLVAAFILLLVARVEGDFKNYGFSSQTQILTQE